MKWQNANTKTNVNKNVYKKPAQHAGAIPWHTWQVQPLAVVDDTKKRHGQCLNKILTG